MFTKRTSRQSSQVPTAYQLSCGAYYRRDLNGASLRMYKEFGLYMVEYADRTTGHPTYAEARERLYSYLRSKGEN